MKQYIVHIVVDDEFGEKLRDLPYREPAWVVDSPINKIIVKELWKIRTDEDHKEGITSFVYNVQDSPENRFMGILGTVLEHHGLYSHDPPCSKINVIGAYLTEKIKKLLLEYDFANFQKTNLGFVAEISSQLVS